MLYWEVRIDDKFQPPDIFTNFRIHLRIKVFTEKGAKDYSTVELPFARKTTISGLQARTIKPDGAIIDMKGDAVKDTDVLKGKKIPNLRVRSFALPAVEPGCIIEYHYNETRMGYLANYERLPLSHEIPVHEVRYLVKPLPKELTGGLMRSMNFQATPPHRGKPCR